MAKKSVVLRTQNRQVKSKKYYFLRSCFKEILSQRISLKRRERLEIHGEIQKLPRDSSFTRIQNRCKLSGRSRGYYRTFGLSRHFVRKLAHQGMLSGVKKASW
jgi:small subunit ribosomal protein S14